MEDQEEETVASLRGGTAISSQSPVISQRMHWTVKDRELTLPINEQ